MRAKWVIAAGAVFAAAILTGGGAWLVRDAWADERAEVAHDADAEAQAVIGAKTAVAARMPEAQSITFGKIFVHWDGEMAAVCGDVDVAEPQDSFDGSERFVYSQGGLLLEEVEGSDALTQKWDDVCK